MGYSHGVISWTFDEWLHFLCFHICLSATGGLENWDPPNFKWKRLWKWVIALNQPTDLPQLDTAESSFWIVAISRSPLFFLLLFQLLSDLWGGLDIFVMCVSKRSPSSGCSDSPSTMGSDVVEEKSCGISVTSRLNLVKLGSFLSESHPIQTIYWSPTSALPIVSDTKHSTLFPEISIPYLHPSSSSKRMNDKATSS